MRWLLTLALLALAAWPAAAQENEAEKLFRELEQKVRTAKTLQIRFDAIITGAEVKKTDDKKKVDAKNWHVKGSVILGEGDKLRAEYEGNLFGQENMRTFVSDGSDWTQFGHTQQPGEAKDNFRGTEKSPKAIGAYLRPALPRDGFILSFITDRRSQLAPDLFILSDFKLAGEEKIGERNTQVIQYTVMPKAKDPSFGTPNVNVTTMKLSMKVWLDTKTKLPVKLAMTGGDSNFNAITETYSEFTVDAKVDAKLFELPKEVQPPGARDGGGEATLKDQEKIQGTWEPSSLSYGGQVTRLQPKDLPTRSFTAAKLVTKDPGTEEQEATFKLNAEKEPKQIDMTDKAGKTVQGIYILDGDTLKIAFCFPATGRPTTFDGKDVFMETLKRQTKK